MSKNITFIIFILFAGLMVPGPAWALHEKSSETRIEDLSKRMDSIEKTTQETAFPGRWMDNISISGLLEVEAGYEKFNPDADEETSEESSDIALSTFELGLDVDFTDHVGGHVLVLWEEDDTEPIDLDEGFISITGTDDLPLYLHAGKLYVPFGNYESFFISDPFTLEIGETRESAVFAGIHEEMVDFSVGCFNGDVNETGKDDHIDSYFSSVTFSMTDDHTNFELAAGVSYISNITDSDALSEANDVDEKNGPDGLEDHVDGISAHMSASFNDSLFCVVEYISAMDDFKAGELSFADTKLQPKAWNVEVAYVFPANVGFAVKYEGTDDCRDFLPENGYGGIIFCHPFENTYLGLEYMYQSFENDDINQIVTAQLAFEF